LFRIDFMEKDKELINILKAELTLLSKDILQNIHQKDIDDLYKASRKLYEKLSAVQTLQKHLNQTEIVDLIQAEQKTVTKPEQKKPADTAPSDPYKNAGKISFKPKDSEKSTSVTKNTGKKMSIGLNDRIAFIKNLFDGNAQAYEQAIERLNAFDSYEEALNYIATDLKPAYNNWEGKDEYEFRLIQLLELKFN